MLFSFYLANEISETPGTPTGAMLAIQLYQGGGANNALALSVSLGEQRLLIGCAGCSKTHPVLLAFMVQRASEHPELLPVVEPQQKVDDSSYEVLGTFSTRFPIDQSGMYDVRLIVISAPVAPLDIDTGGRFITKGGARTKISSPAFAAGNTWMAGELSRLGYGSWQPIDPLPLKVGLSSTASPTGAWDTDYRIDFASPPPDQVTEFEIAWIAKRDQALFNPTATVVSPLVEGSNTRWNITAGAMLGAAVVLLLDACVPMERWRKRPA